MILLYRPPAWLIRAKYYYNYGQNASATAAYVYAHEQLGLCFYVLGPYFVVLDIHLNYTKLY